MFDRHKINGSKIISKVYHGGLNMIEKFNRPDHGVYFSPHREWAKEYGPKITTCYLWIPKLYMVVSDSDLFDALFDRDYKTVAEEIKKLERMGYYACQTSTDSEMIVVFKRAKIYNATTGKEM